MAVSSAIRPVGTAACKNGEGVGFPGIGDNGGRRPCPTMIQEIDMHMSVSLTPLVSLVAGILILLMPRLLNNIIAIYLIVIGLIGLFGARWV